MIIKPDIQVFLLNITQNINYINTNLIPKSQLDTTKQFKFKYDGVKRLLARSFLFELLHRYYGIVDFEFDFNSYGKPFLKSDSTLNFSFSYCRDYVFVGLAKNRSIGIDIEYVNPVLNVEEIATEIMCFSEFEQFHLLSGVQRRQKFCIEVLSAKESITKAFGTGLFCDVKNINTSTSDVFEYDGAKFIYHALGLFGNEYVMALCYEDCPITGDEPHQIV